MNILKTLLCSLALLLAATGAQGQGLKQFADSLMAYPNTEIHSVIVTRDGQPLLQAYSAPFNRHGGHQLHSVSKTFVAMAIGMLVDEGRLKVTDRIVDIFPELRPADAPEAYDSITVHHLLTMTSGLRVDWQMRQRRPDLLRGYLSEMSAPLGTYAYDSNSSYALCAVVQRLTGQTVFEFLTPRLFVPLGLTEARWEESAEGITTGGWGLYLRPESLARAGQLLLNHGRWGDRQLLSPEWVDLMMSWKTDALTSPGYGYQMWVEEWPEAARMDGSQGQFVIVSPQHQMVCVITQAFTGNSPQARQQRDLLWRLVAPIIATADSIAPDSLHYALATPQGAPRGNAKHIQIADIADNASGWTALDIDMQPDSTAVLTITDAQGGITRLPMAYGQWQLSRVVAYWPPNANAATLNAWSNMDDVDFVASAAYAWVEPDHLQVKIQYTNWGTASTLDIRLDPESHLPISLTDTRNYAPKRPITLYPKP